MKNILSYFNLPPFNLPQSLQGGEQNSDNNQITNLRSSLSAMQSRSIGEKEGLKKEIKKLNWHIISFRLFIYQN